MVCEISWHMAITCALEEFENSVGTDLKKSILKQSKQSDFLPVSLRKNIGMLCMQELLFWGGRIT